MQLDQVRQDVLKRIEQAKREGADALLIGDLDKAQERIQHVRELHDLCGLLAECERRLALLAIAPAPKPQVEVAAPPKEEPPAPIKLREPSVDVAPPPPPPPPKPTRQEKERGKKAKAVRDAFFVLSARVLDDGLDVRVFEATAKQAVCLGRAVIELDPESSEAIVVRDEIERISRKWNRTWDAQFFGFGWQRHQDAGTWELLAELYSYLQTTSEMVDWLETGVEQEPLREQLITCGASVETSLYRLFDSKGMVVHDDQRFELNRRLRDLVGDRYYIPCWKVEGSAPLTQEAVLEEARRLPSLFPREMEKLAGQEDRIAAQERLMELANGHYKEDFETELCEATIAGINAKIPPSDKQLRHLLLPYRGILPPDGPPNYKRLLEFLAKDATALLVGHKAPTDLDTPEDPEHAARLQAVRKYLTGKTMLFVGGRKGQTLRREDIEKQLKLKFLDWPDAEESTNPSIFDSKVAKADVVCQLVRYSRHSYKQVLDMAKRQGKATVMIPKGLGFNTVLYELHRQLSLD